MKEMYPRNQRSMQVSITVAVAPWARLDVSVQALGRLPVHHQTHVRLVNPHAEGGGGAHHACLVAHELLLRQPALLSRHPRVVILGLHP